MSLLIYVIALVVLMTLFCYIASIRLVRFMDEHYRFIMLVEMMVELVLLTWIAWWAHPLF